MLSCLLTCVFSLKLLLQESACYTADQLFAIFDVPHTGVAMENFVNLCPALVQQKLYGSCSAAEETGTTDDKPSLSERKLIYFMSKIRIPPVL